MTEEVEPPPLRTSFAASDRVVSETTPPTKRTPTLDRHRVVIAVGTPLQTMGTYSPSHFDHNIFSPFCEAKEIEFDSRNAPLPAVARECGDDTATAAANVWTSDTVIQRNTA